jgi:REP element-mobilizing transposase RayT
VQDFSFYKSLLPFAGKKQMETRHGSHSLYSLQIHLVWITKYRYQVLQAIYSSAVEKLFAGVVIRWIFK